MLKSLPVLMYHYISSWPDAISVAPELFEDHLKAMTRAGYRGIGLDEAAAFLREGRSLPKKSVLITFDDGFLDNYVYAWPLLREHGHKGVIFAVTNKIVHEERPRPTLSDVWDGYVGLDDLPQVNNPFRTGKEGLRVRTDLFFSWKEARAMETDGTVRVAGHTHYHRSVFTSPRFSGLFMPGGRKRTFDRFDAPVLFGLPKFEEGPAMKHRAFKPSEELYALVRESVPQDFATAFDHFKEPGRAQDLLRRIREIPESRLGSYESHAEFEERIYEELRASRDMLRTELGREADVLAWPWGAYSDESLRIAKELGFTVLFTTNIGPNPPGMVSDAVNRFKARARRPAWLLSRLAIYSRPLVARTYGLFHKR
ncbi:peptidoglycan/xylan/chitin deacetylase (PgdA/CDA1 family) [Desulfobaculum xiamenense]|uniref:Peptidoglycan/xylan/chitin deacetylase (PgdA/CDA1 family) n=1 Tax=Desulfobaculum xiamenense TaxID=995050 RepID=A0A846QL53_9BACT|nr:polysaccharide deacetylase family protein [Desulfobaculum xiamenense]NJB67780.1 peptidoglycan/xylan/chitin deacetylase (PgdA/CDA1 family) [Desulfobaculum xiamenense]